MTHSHTKIMKRHFASPSDLSIQAGNCVLKNLAIMINTNRNAHMLKAPIQNFSNSVIVVMVNYLDVRKRSQVYVFRGGTRPLTSGMFRN